MKKIFQILSMAVIVLTAASCSGEITITPNEQGLYGLKQGSKWIAEPVYTQLFLEHFVCGDFYIAKKIPGTQEYYHVVYDSKGKLVKECNAGFFFDKDEKKYSDLLCATPEGTCSYFRLDSLKVIMLTSTTVGYWGKDIIHYSLSSKCREEKLLDYWEKWGKGNYERLLYSPSAVVETASTGYSKTIPQSVIMDEAVTLDKGGACYAFKQNGESEMSFWPGIVIFTDQGLVVGVSADRPHHYNHEVGEKTNYFFYPNAEVNKDALYKLGLTARIGLLFENGQWNVVSIEPKKTGGGNHVEIVAIAGNVSTKTIDDSVYKKRMEVDHWHPTTVLFGALLQGSYGSWSWPFYLSSAANQK
ncbi:MAG: hypothetical protein LBT50_04085 [Prevotellaceae bacterium]|jgi:hypothetical protein|nr:hypothetical protein [Prevotellaceae bacterium]